MRKQYKNSKDYEQFVEKFKQKKTTDDCYTPPIIYDAVSGWVCKEYGVTPDQIVRPFYPGGDFKNFEYPKGCVVLDNPPFSILSKIVTFYLEREIAFFLFCQTLIALNIASSFSTEFTHIITGNSVTYENGAKVSTSFITNLEKGTVAKSCPSLYEVVSRAEQENPNNASKKARAKYKYPMNLLTVSNLQKYSKSGVFYSVGRSECFWVTELDHQKFHHKKIYGGGLLISEKAAAEKAAAEKAAAEKAAAEKAAAKIWELSDREIEIIKSLGDK